MLSLSLSLSLLLPSQSLVWLVWWGCYNALQHALAKDLVLKWWRVESVCSYMGN